MSSNRFSGLVFSERFGASDVKAFAWKGVRSRSFHWVIRNRFQCRLVTETAPAIRIHGQHRLLQNWLIGYSVGGAWAIWPWSTGLRSSSPTLCFQRKCHSSECSGKNTPCTSVYIVYLYMSTDS